jgi:NAD(P)H-flavin reductase
MVTSTYLEKAEATVVQVHVPNPMLPTLYRVNERRQETVDTWTLELEPANGGPCPVFLPGQFNMLYVYGKAELAISISGDPSWHDTLTHTVRAVGVGSNALTSMRPGDVVGVRGPFGKPWPMTELEGKDVIVLAGGIGLAPLRPTIYSLMANRARYNEVIILYGARTPGDLIYKHELELWGWRHEINLGVTVDRADPSWNGNVGVVTTMISTARFDPMNVVALVCGPEVMMRFTVMELQRRGVPDESIYISMERNMKCALGICGHCQLGPDFVCKDGPVFRYDHLAPLFGKREV